MINKAYPITTQMEARRQGHRFYYTGKPCKYGHYNLRYSSSSNCVECRTWNSRSGVAANAHRNVHWFTKPAQFSAFDYPSSIEWELIQDDVIRFAHTVWRNYKHRVGEPMVPREKWPDDIRLQVIEEHLCAWLYNDEGRDFWYPVYMGGVKAHPRYNAYAWTLFDEEHDGGGIWFDGSYWVVSSARKGSPSSIFMLTDDQLRQMDRPVPSPHKACPACHK